MKFLESSNSETENSMMVVRGQERKNGELASHGYRLSVLQDENSSGDDGWW